MKTIVKFDSSAFKEYNKLKSMINNKSVKPSYKQLLKSIDKAIEKIRLNYKTGDLIPRKYLSNEIIDKYGTDKIFRIELVGYWRLLYTLIGNEVEIIAFILEFMSHDDYNKLFGYRKR